MGTLCIIWMALLVYDFFMSLSSQFAGCYACHTFMCNEIGKFSCAFSTKVDTEEEEEEDKEDSPAPTDSVSVEFIDNII